MAEQQRSEAGKDIPLDTQFQLAIRERRINELLVPTLRFIHSSHQNEIEQLKYAESSNDIPPSIDSLIKSLTRDVKSNNDDIHLLQQALCTPNDSGDSDGYDVPSHLTLISKGLFMNGSKWKSKETHSILQY
jgi:hypothetical protein